MAMRNSEGIDWFDPSVQVKLRLTADEDVLKARQRDPATWQTERGGRQALVLRENSREYKFYPGEELVVPATVAAGLIKSSVVTVGTHPLTDPYEPALDIISKWTLGQKEPSEKQKAICPECNDEFATAKLLAGHIMSEHSDELLITTPNMDAHLKGKKVPVNA